MNVSSTIPWLVGGLVASIAFAAPISAEPTSQPLLIAQQVVDGLPPPPPLVFGQETPAASPVGQSTEGQPSVPVMSPSDPAQRYLVIVNGDSSLLLSQVQSVVPDASLQEYNGQRFIQAGMFDHPNTAQQQVETLAAQGIGAEIVTVNTAQLSAEPSSTTVQSSQQAAAPASLPPPDLLPAQPVPREIEFGQPPTPEQAVPQPSSAPQSPQMQRTESTTNRAYYVVVPGRADDVEAITNQILRLGDGLSIAEMVQVDDGRGSHVRIGPFVDRSAARRWNSYFREFGLHSRIHYRH